MAGGGKTSTRQTYYILSFIYLIMNTSCWLQLLVPRTSMLKSQYMLCMLHTRSQDCVTDLSLSYDSRKNVTSLMIFPSRLFSAEPLPHLCEGLTFTLPVSKSYSHFLVLLGSETDWRVRNLGFETLDVLCSSQPLKVSHKISHFTLNTKCQHSQTKISH